MQAGGPMVSERSTASYDHYACRIVGQHRGPQRYVPTEPADADGLTRVIVTLASEYGRDGDRRVTTLLDAAGWPGARTGFSASGVARGNAPC
ncbi:hypothetical protein FHR71_005096 [Methylobacterium sp. RAS18]|nr:hypothetical protein [Methylobacterium sp. RAS18]